jgi:hypothetical protein
MRLEKWMTVLMKASSKQLLCSVPYQTDKRDTNVSEVSVFSKHMTHLTLMICLPKIMWIFSAFTVHMYRPW